MAKGLKITQKYHIRLVLEEPSLVVTSRDSYTLEQAMEVLEKIGDGEQYMLMLDNGTAYVTGHVSYRQVAHVFLIPS